MPSEILFTTFLGLQLLLAPAFAQSPILAARDGEFCGYDWSLPETEITKEYYRIESQRISLGYVRVCDEILQNFDFQKIAKPWKELLPLLGFIPVELGATPFAQFELIGGVLNAKIPRFANLSRTDHATRIFRRKDGLIVTLGEWDLSIQGGGTDEVYRGPDVQVKGWPGYWTIGQSKAGKTYSSLWWQGETRKFELTINTNLKLTGGRDEILRLAEIVPPGIPAGKLKARIAFLGIPGVLSKRPFPDRPDF